MVALIMARIVIIIILRVIVSGTIVSLIGIVGGCSSTRTLIIVFY
jgi:hypothetical protein